MKGKLQKNSEGQWVIWHKKDFDMCATDGGDISIHEQHSFWLKMWGEEGMELAFERQGSEVILKASGPGTHSYTQD